MKLFELSDQEVNILKDMINVFTITGNKKQIKEYDKQTDKILEKLNKPIMMGAKDSGQLPKVKNKKNEDNKTKK